LTTHGPGGKPSALSLQELCSVAAERRPGRKKALLFEKRSKNFGYVVYA
jgi:hypothetical protein